MGTGVLLTPWYGLGFKVSVLLLLNVSELHNGYSVLEFVKRFCCRRFLSSVLSPHPPGAILEGALHRRVALVTNSKSCGMYVPSQLEDSQFNAEVG